MKNNNIYVVVEADGEKEALPILMRRILELHHEYAYQIKAQNAGGRGGILRENGLERFLEKGHADQCKAILILLDLEDQEICPVELAQTWAYL